MRSAFRQEEVGDEAKPRGAIRLMVKNDNHATSLECEVLSSVRDEDGSFSGWLVNPIVKSADVMQAVRIAREQRLAVEGGLSEIRNLAFYKGSRNRNRAVGLLTA